METEEFGHHWGLLASHSSLGTSDGFCTEAEANGITGSRCLQPGVGSHTHTLSHVTTFSTALLAGLVMWLASANGVSVNATRARIKNVCAVWLGLLSSCDCRAGSRRMWNSLEPNPQTVRKTKACCCKLCSVYVIC